MTVLTGLSGNEIYCLAQKGLQPGSIVVGNSVHALGLLRFIGTGFKSMVGGELSQVTQLIADGRATAYRRMLAEATARKATGVTGVTSELIVHGRNIEFLSVASAVHAATERRDNAVFSTADSGQELYAQLDAGFEPLCFAFGNVAYSLGIGRSILGSLKTLARGEIKEYSDIFNHTRHLALERIIAHAKQYNANSVLGIRTTIVPFGNANEMIMAGTASRCNKLLTTDQIITSGMTNTEMWSLAKMGYMPLRLLLGTSVYSLGLIGSISASLKSFVRGEITELTRMIYAARENALSIIYQEAKAIGADEIIGVKTHVYQLGNGLIEFLATGTAVKKNTNIQTATAQLPPQAIVTEHTSFYDSKIQNHINIQTNAGSKGIPQARQTSLLSSMLWGSIAWIALAIFMYLWWYYPLLKKF